MLQVLGTGYWLRLSLRIRLPKSHVVAAVGFSSSFVFGFGFGFEIQSQWLWLPTFQIWKPLASVFGFQIIFLEAAGFGCGFLSFKMEATGFGFGLGFLSPSWLRPRLRSHQPGFQPNPASEVLLAIYLVLPFTKHQAISKAGLVKSILFQWYLSYQHWEVNTSHFFIDTHEL